MFIIKPVHLIKDINIMFKGLLIVTIIVFSFSATAADIVSYSVKYIKPIGAGYVELEGQGKRQVNGETPPYEGTKYISTKNIDSMTGYRGISKGCMLHFSSESLTENISVTKQSCSEIISIISIVNK